MKWYKGTVCLKRRKLVITYAKSARARKWLEEFIGYEPPGKKITNGKRKKKTIGINKTKHQQINGQIHMFAM